MNNAHTGMLKGRTKKVGFSGFYLEHSSLMCLIVHLLHSRNPFITGLPLYLFGLQISL